MAEAGGGLSVTTSVALAKDIFSLLRDATLFFGLVLLLLFPVTFNKTLNDAGIVEMNAGFAQWKTSLVSTNDQLKVANDTITSLRANQEKVLSAVAQPDQGANPAQQNAIQAARVTLQTSDVAAQQIQRNVQATLQSNASLVAGDSDAKASAPTSATPGICYQEQDPRQPLEKRYSVHCHVSKALCDTARGPNPATVQTQCVAVAIADARWSPTRGGFLGSWYEYRSTPFPAPFPPLPRQ